MSKVYMIICIVYDSWTYIAFFLLSHNYCIQIEVHLFFGSIARALWFLLECSMARALWFGSRWRAWTNNMELTNSTDIKSRTMFILKGSTKECEKKLNLYAVFKREGLCCCGSSGWKWRYFNGLYAVLVLLKLLP